MPDTGEVTSEPTQAPEQDAAGATPSDVAELGDPGKRAIAAEREARKAAEKQAEAFRAQLDEIKKSQMSDLEKAQATAQEVQAEAEKARSEALRWRIAAKHGISDEDAETFLTGSDENSLKNVLAAEKAGLKVAPKGQVHP